MVGYYRRIRVGGEGGIVVTVVRVELSIVWVLPVIVGVWRGAKRREHPWFFLVGVGRAFSLVVLGFSALATHR